MTRAFQKCLKNQVGHATLKSYLLVQALMPFGQRVSGGDGRGVSVSSEPRTSQAKVATRGSAVFLVETVPGPKPLNRLLHPEHSSGTCVGLPNLSVQSWSTAFCGWTGLLSMYRIAW